MKNIEDGGHNWPKYRSHKIVEAKKIVGFSKFRLDEEKAELILEGDERILVRVEDLDSRRVPDSIYDGGDPEEYGYFVVYEDGYWSWSPTKAFEEGYALIEDNWQSLEQTVFPSNRESVAVLPDADYGGAHRYRFTNSLGFNNGEAQYAESTQEIQFVQKNEDGSMTPGLQSEQLLIALIDRHKKLNAKYPSEEGEAAITMMELALGYLEERVKKRIERGVMGQLKK